MTIDQQPRLRAALRSLAEVPAPADPGAAALHRSGRIRRRHRALAAGVSALAVIAVAVTGVGIGRTAAPAPAPTPADPAAGGPRYAITSYRVLLNRKPTMLLNPRTGRYTAISDPYAVTSPDGSRVLQRVGTEHDGRVIDRDALLAGQLDRAWSFTVPDGSCRSEWTPDSRAVLCVPMGDLEGEAEWLVLADAASRSLRRITLEPAGRPIGNPAVISPQGEIAMFTEDASPRLGTTGVQVVIYSPTGRLLRSIPLQTPLSSRMLEHQPPLLASPNGRQLLLRDGRSVDLRTGIVVGPGVWADGPGDGISPFLDERPLRWYDDRTYLRLDAPPRWPGVQRLSVVDVETGTTVRSIQLTGDSWTATVGPVDALEPNPGPWVI